MLSGRKQQLPGGTRHRWDEFTVTAVAIHRGQCAKVSVRLIEWIAFVFAFHCIAPTVATADTKPSVQIASDSQIIAALRNAGNGFSTDEIVIDDQHRERFLAAIDPEWQSLGDLWQRETLLRLIALRKAGKVDVKATQRGRLADPDLVHIAEIAGRSVLDRHPVSTDTLLCDPSLRRELQVAATAVFQGKSVPQVLAAPPPDAYSIRKHLLRLRKTRQLRPELVQRVADWDRTIESFTLEQLTAALNAGKISTGAGVYLFYDSTGYLYIGEAANLKTRLLQHTNQSDRVTLDQYLRCDSKGSITVELHTFGAQSPGNELSIRRAYESDLIRTRQPRFNIRP